MTPSLIVHGGAWDIPDESVDACKAGCHRALAAGWSVLSSGASGLDAVEAAVVVLEDDPVFDAGYGSHLTLDGYVECDAIVMDGATLRAGSVAALRHIRNPIRLARQVLENCPHMMLVAEGAERFAAQQGLTLCAPEDLISEAERDAWLKCRNSKHAAAHHRGHQHGWHLLQTSRALGGFTANWLWLLRRRGVRRRFLHWLWRSDHENSNGKNRR
jgi:L-asparaginase / beta-aspartyl-peptidase